VQKAARPTILLLDDFPDSSEAVATWLAIEGWRPLMTSTVEEALAILAQEQIDALVMEPHLRSGSAMEVAEAARKSPFGCPLLVAMTTVGRTGDDTAYEPTLFDFNLVKPTAMELLSHVLAVRRRR
jgi:two-component system, OmpR family, response regulator